MADSLVGLGFTQASVGQALTKSQVFSTRHPLYRMISDTVTERVHQLSAQRGDDRASARATVVTVALNQDELRTLSELYPEFVFLNYANNRPGHAWWVQSRRLANEWLMMQAEQYTDKIAHLGGSVIPYLLGSLPDASLLFDANSPVAVHERHAASLDAYRLFRNYAKLQGDLGRDVDRVKYEAHLRREVFRQYNATSVVPPCEVLCVDGVVYPYGPWQVAMMMKQGGASMAFGCFVYHPNMLLESEGEIPGTGVFFRKSADGLQIQYPEGAAGATHYKRDVWEAWLASHVFSVGSANKMWFQLELLQNRGPFMFYRIVALSREPERKVITHALQLGPLTDSYVVNSYRMKRFGLDPTKGSSWEFAPFIVGKRLVDRVYQFAMALKQEDFTRYAIRKQIHVVNDRVTIEGTSVVVHSPLGIQMVDSLVVAIYSRAFVDRYEAGQLVNEVMNNVKTLAGFSGTTFLTKVTMIARACAFTAYDYTFGYVDAVMRKFWDSVRDRFSSTMVFSETGIVEVPPYILITDVASSWMGRAGPESMRAVVAERGRQAGLNATGFGSRWVRAMSLFTPKIEAELDRLQVYQYRVEQVPLFNTHRAETAEAEEVLSIIRESNPLQVEPEDRYSIEAMEVVRAVDKDEGPGYHVDPDPIQTLNELYSVAIPGVARQDLEYDTASLSFDPQDRVLAAPYMRLPKYLGDGPGRRLYYKSRLKALNVPKRQGTLQELISAIAARNLNAPQVSLPQDENEMVKLVWENFLDKACVPEARDKLRQYRSDPVAMAEDAFREWFGQQDAGKLKALRGELEKDMIALEEQAVGDYMVMGKADVKPPLSKKPLYTRTEPQVIVYHNKSLNALYSSIFRVLVRRLQSILAPNIHVNLLKDTRDIEAFLQSIHPFGRKGLKYLENDFSKYDKSQGRFVFMLERYVFEQLGMDQEMLDHWMGGHVECSMRSLALGLSLHVYYQRKSGDATTAFGNVLLNIMSVLYAYADTEIVWALFMGDDSLVCATQVGSQEVAIDVLAEVFNLGAKMYIMEHPYFASNFVVIDHINQRVVMLPDPIKRAERWSMAVSAEDPQWHERYVSARDSMQNYIKSLGTPLLARAVAERYDVSVQDVAGAGDAIATLISSELRFRSIWEESPELSIY